MRTNRRASREHARVMVETYDNMRCLSRTAYCHARYALGMQELPPATKDAAFERVRENHHRVTAMHNWNYAVRGGIVVG